MWVFIDDSGDPGFKFDQGSSTHLTLAACVFRERASIEEAIRLIEGSRYAYAENGQSINTCREYKYSKTRDDHKDRFFKSVEPASFDVRAIVVDKRQLRSDHLRANPNDLKSYLIRQMLTHTYGQVSNADIIIDGKDTRAFGATDQEYFMRMVNGEKPGTIKRVQFVDSRESAPIQLADMVAGSIRKTYEGCPKSRSFLDTYRARTHQPHGSVWNFK